MVGGTAVMNPLLRSFNVPVFNFWQGCFTPPPASEVMVVQILTYSMSALHRSSTFTMFKTKFAATCTATSIPYASLTFAMTYFIRPRNLQAASFGSTLPKILEHTLAVTRRHVSLIHHQPLEQTLCRSSPNHLVQQVPSYNNHFRNLTYQIRRHSPLRPVATLYYSRLKDPVCLRVHLCRAS